VIRCVAVLRLRLFGLIYAHLSSALLTGVETEAR
jgi:hypothetical protein